MLSSCCLESVVGFHVFFLISVCPSATIPTFRVLAGIRIRNQEKSKGLTFSRRVHRTTLDKNNESTTKNKNLRGVLSYQ